MRNRWTEVRTCIAAGALIALALAGVAAAAEPSPALQKVIAAAKQEGKLDVQWPTDLFGGIEGVAAMGKGMNAMFGTNIAVNFVPFASSVPRMLNTIIMTQQAGQPSPTNLFVAPNTLTALAWKRKVIVPVDWKALLPGRIDDKMIEADGTAIRIFTTLPGGIVYNTKLAPYRPQYLTDLLKPEWKGRIATTPYAANYDLLAANDWWGPAKTMEFGRKMAAQISGLLECGNYERIASGEFIGFEMDCAGTQVARFKRQGAPIDEVIPRDDANVRFYYVGLVKNAKQPNAAKLFTVFALTPEGQKILWKYADTDIYTFPESEMGKLVTADEKAGIKFRQIDIDWVERHPEITKPRLDIIKILTRK
jgi:ABC-type Fe3+ transport system substrate-binding protein